MSGLNHLPAKETYILHVPRVQIPHCPPVYWEVAQLVEQRFLVPQVAGSSPAFPAKVFKMLVRVIPLVTHYVK